MGIVDKILKKRGIGEEYLGFHKEDELDFPELDEVVNVLSTQFFLQEVGKVGVHYDVDVDGLYAGYILEDVLGRMGKDVVNFINPMKKHGFTKESIEWVREQRLEWLFVVDAGSSDFGYMKECLEMGTKVVVLDHHPYEEEKYPEGIWVINISKYPELPPLSGCGVVYRFIEKVGKIFGIDTKQYETFVGITVMSDMCSMAHPESRYYVSKAYDGYRDTEFLKKFRFYGSHRSFYGWGVNPYLNALIRTGEEKKAVMIVNNMNRLAKMNRVPDDVKRVKARQERMKEDLFSRGELRKRKGVVLHLRHGVDELASLNGLVANQLVKEHGVGALVLAYNKEYKVWQGSFRGLQFTNKELTKWGFWVKGHDFACGVKIDNEGLKKFYKDFSYSSEVDRGKADIYINSGQLTKEDWMDIAAFNEYSGTDMKEIIVAYMRGEEEITTEEEEYGVQSIYTKDGEIKDFTSGNTGDLRVVPILDKEGYQFIRA